MATRQTQPRAGRYQALVHLSIGRRDGMSDRIEPGEIVSLTEEQAAHFLDSARFRVSPVRPAADADKPLPRVTPRQLTQVRPVAGQFGVRADPPGSTTAVVVEDARVPEDGGPADDGNPEAHEPQPGDENK